MPSCATTLLEAFTDMTTILKHHKWDFLNQNHLLNS